MDWEAGIPLSLFGVFSAIFVIDDESYREVISFF
jgi:hypothetical protein